MIATNDGGPAFPGEQGHDGCGTCKREIGADGTIQWLNLNQGMSLRDYFAANYKVAHDSDGDIQGASQDVIGAVVDIPYPPMDENNKSKTWQDRVRWQIQAEAKLQYMHADAMLAAREATK
jgi:hypothetical protein